MSWRTDKGILEHFNHIKERRDFVTDVAELRKRAKIDADGLNVEKLLKKDENEYFFNWLNHVPGGSEQVVETGVADILRKHELGHHLEDIVRAYVIFGQHMPSDNWRFTGIEKTVGCALDQKADASILYIYPEATLNRTISFLKQNWSEIENLQMQVAYEKEASLKSENWSEIETQDIDWQRTRFQTRIKTRTQSVRNEKLIELSKLGVLRVSGIINQQNAKKFLSQRGIEIEDFLDIDSGLKKLGYAVPKNPDTTKKALQRHIKNIKK